MPGIPFPQTPSDVAYDPTWEIARTGLYQGRPANVGYMQCRRSAGWSSTSELGDVCNYLDTSQANINIPVVGTPYYIVSSSAADNPTGTGIRSVRVNYLDTNGVRTVVTVALNGTTPVLLGSNIKYVQYMESALIGSAGVAAGDIYISSNAGGLPTVQQTIEKIAVNAGRSMSGRVMVPADYHLYLVGWSAFAVSNTMDVRLRGQAYTDDRTVSPGFHFQLNAYLANGQNLIEPIPFLRFEPGAQIKVSAIPGGAPAGNRCDSTFKFLLIGF